MNKNINSACQNIFRICKRKWRCTAAEKFFEGVGKVLINLIKALDKHFFHLLCEVGNKLFNLFLWLFNIIYLCAHKFISFGNFFVLFNSGYIYISQRPDFLFKLVKSPLRLFWVINFNSTIFCLSSCQFVFFPKLWDNIIILLLNVDFSLFKSGKLSARGFTLWCFITLNSSDFGTAFFKLFSVSIDFFNSFWAFILIGNQLFNFCICTIYKLCLFKNNTFDSFNLLI